MAVNLTRRDTQRLFKPLDKAAAATMPVRGQFSQQLTPIVQKAGIGITALNQNVARLFATAAVEMWHRSVHSFLVSASTTMASPLWSSVSGYYSSHYSMRAFAHVLGYYQMFNAGKILRIEADGNQFKCDIQPKKGGDNEHRLYWTFVKKQDPFLIDPFFTNNDEIPKKRSQGEESHVSDREHRNIANYWDHVNLFPKFKVLDEAYLQQRVTMISRIPVSDAPIPRMESYPDVENVQLVAYHRMVRFRSYLDEILGRSNRFWSVHRRPSWCPDFLDFQLVQPQYSSIYAGLV